MSEEHHEDTFDSAGAGASKTIPQQCSALRKGGFVMLKDHPCKIVDMSTSKTGKHGHAKVHLVGIDIFTAKKYEDQCPSTHKMDVPVIKRQDYQYICRDGQFVSLMDESGNMKNDIRIPEDPEILAELVSKEEKGEDFMISVQSACDMEAICGFKVIGK